MERRIANGILAVVFLLLIVAPHLSTLTSIALERELEEKRQLASPPIWSGLKNAPRYTKELDAYINDHFPLRSGLISLHAALKRQVFFTSPSEQVVIGKDGWLFVRDSLDKRDAIPKPALSALKAQIQQQASWLAAQGIPYLIVLVPDKATVYPEYLPSIASHSSAQSRLVHLTKELENVENLEILNLEAVLWNAKARGITYKKTDTHWTLFGALEAYRAIITRAQKLNPAVASPLLDYSGLEKIEFIPGDLGVIVGATRDMTDFDYRIKDDALGGCNPKRERLPAYSERKLPLRMRPFATTCETEGPRALIFRDSFGSALVPFLSKHFSRAAFIWDYPTSESLKTLVASESPEIVIELRVSRYLTQKHPGN